MRKSHGARRPRPKPVKWISIARLLLLLACAAGWMATGTPAYFALYLTAWSVSHELTRKYKPRWSEGPSYVRKLWVALAEQAMRGRDTGDIPVRFHMPLWIAACRDHGRAGDLGSAPEDGEDDTRTVRLSQPLAWHGNSDVDHHHPHDLHHNDDDDDGSAVAELNHNNRASRWTNDDDNYLAVTSGGVWNHEPRYCEGHSGQNRNCHERRLAALASVVGCQTNRASILTHSLSVVWLDAPSGQSAVVGNIRLANLGSVVVHPESLAEFQSLLDSAISLESPCGLRPGLVTFRPSLK